MTERNVMSRGRRVSISVKARCDLIAVEQIILDVIGIGVETCIERGLIPEDGYTLDIKVKVNKDES